MENDSFDIGGFEKTCSFVTSTTWSSRVASKPKGRKTYGRRGNDAVVKNRKINNPARSRVASLERTPESSPSTSLFESAVKEKEKSLVENIEDEEWNTDNQSQKFNRDSDISTPTIRKCRAFVRSHTIGDDSPNTSKPTRPPQLRRSQSVHSVTNSLSSRSSSSRSFSTTSSVASMPVEEERDFENSNPNFFDTPSNNSLLDNISPKRSAIFKGGNKCRKKSKPANNNAFLQNDFTPLAVSNDSGVNNSKSKLLPGSLDSFSDLARNFGEARTSWATSSTESCPDNCSSRNEESMRLSSPTDLFSSTIIYPDQAIDSVDNGSSPAISMASSTRKRGVCRSQFSDDESAVSRSRSRILSPPSIRMSEVSCYSASVDSKFRVGSRLMDVSFQSTNKSVKIDRIMTDVTMSDDDVNVSCENDDDSDISIDSGDEEMSIIPLLNSIRRKRPSYSTRLELEKATIDDIVKSTSSIEDIEFLSASLQKSIIRQGGCLIAPPVSWEAKRRDAFFRWTTKSLGFKFCPGGGNFSYIQTTKNRGNRLLGLLNAAIKSLKTRSEGELRESLSNFEENSSKAFDFSFVTEKELQPASQVSNSYRLTPKELTSNSSCHRSVYDRTDELTQGMSRLNVNSKPISKNIETVGSSFYIDDGFDGHSGKDCSRPSLEHHVNAADLNAHLHGATPVPPRLSGRPPRLSLQSMSSRTTISTNIDSQSPFTMNSTLSKPIHVNCAPNSDFVLTPLIGRQDVHWGSRPFNDRDWGASDSCKTAVIEKMFYQFSQSRIEAGFNEVSDRIQASNDHTPSCIGLDFDDTSQYRDDFHSLASSTSPEETGIDQSESSRTGMCLAVIDNHSIKRTDERFPSRDVRRRQTSFAKHNRMSLFASAVNPADAFSQQRKSLFVRQSCLFPACKRTLLQESAQEFLSRHTAVIDESTRENFNNREESPFDSSEILRMIFDFLQENELLLVIGLVSTKWSDVATHSHANLMLSSVACVASDEEKSKHGSNNQLLPQTGVPTSMDRSWDYLTTSYPWACFLSEGAYKRVYKVFNQCCQTEEAVSVMDVKLIQSTGNINVVGAELAVSVMLSSLVRRGICPNFIATRGIFSCRYEPPESHWGSANNKKPRGNSYWSSKVRRRPREPKQHGHFQYIRMELCDEGDAEEFLKRQPDESVSPFQARRLLFQISFALHAAADKFSLKHYDVKLLNIFLQRISKKKDGNVVLRYGLGEHTFSLQSSREEAIIAKLADYGTANVDCATSGQDITIAQFTTLENTPPEFLIMGDQARQGHGHDNFGLGICFLHLFTGHAPYEEILEGVTCPINLKIELRRIWENEEESQYTVVRSIVLADVYKDEYGDIIEGESDETLYDTLYKYIVLFGVPNNSSPFLNSKVMTAVKNTLSSDNRQKKSGRGRNRKVSCDAKEFICDQNKFSLSHGTNRYIARARTSLSSMDGGMDLLLSLVKFDPQSRASALDVLNSSFMASLREIPNGDNCYKDEDEVLSFTAFST
mmetsp:Transcript_58141/g.65002  ORF Transcript_58141/g.65002 Transcript_58141/m.65002 type:complete len:1499 (-) Transcript_58141:1235-5731(-)